MTDLSFPPGGGASLGSDAAFSGDNDVYLTVVPADSDRNLIISQDAAAVPLGVKAAVGQTAAMYNILNSAGVVVAKVTLGQILAASGTGGAPGLGFISDPATGVNLVSAGVLGLVGGNWQVDYQSFRCFRDTACVVMGELEDASLKWAAAGTFRLLAGASGLGSLLLGQKVRARTADLTLTVAESGIHYTNTGAAGAVIFTLPAATLANEVAPTYQFTVTAAQNLQVLAAGTDTIQIAGAVITAGGGNVVSNAVAATLRITCTSTGAWTALAGGVWI